MAPSKSPLANMALASVKESPGARLTMQIVTPSLEYGAPDVQNHFARQFIHGKQHCPHPDKGAHDLNIYSHGARTAEDAGQHGNTLLGEGMRQVTPATVTT